MTTELGAEVNPLNGQLWPVETVMARLSVGRSTAFNLMASGQLRSVKVGRRRLVSEASLCEYIASLESDSVGGDAA
ncbi:DNA binding domain-containing protein, excisionase family [Mycolicibacterium neoaurum]|uniref:helix-turn-helix domain-containing protein n=1 Tax=Mycolicibacterium neoaurum TaxID=1795 RepID=UPI00056B29E3|nr:helix-turn-helix domain-containing protein [Mycolicibacterium neoaurum]SDC25476.1 DNA binding domain-containing protein, excisionase family [Mycolicibacterium neoaurum]